MKRLFPRNVILLLLAAATLPCTGCFWVTTEGPYLGFVSIPIPISPYFQKNREDKAWDQERYARTPILDPIPEGGAAIGVDEPSDDEVMRKLEKIQPVSRDWPLLYTEQRDNVRIVKEKISDYVDPPRVYPLVGPAQLHHVHYKCTVYYTHTKRAGWPLPHTIVDEDAREVIYIDKDHLHRVGNADAGTGPIYQ